ncbi:MAG TPA: ABC transporter permease [bacterium]|nr:ABC transporter permease [bacterium]
MPRFVVARVLATIPVLVGVSLVVFLTMKMIPGDAAEVLAGPQATREQVELIRQSLGLNRPLYVQYVSWLSRAGRGDLGRSIQLDAPVTEMVLDRLKNTLVLALASALLAVAIGVPVGILSAMRQSSIVDRASVVLAMFGNSMPTFWLGLVLILIFSLQFRLFPSNGMFSLRGPAGIPDLLWHLTLPAFTLCGVPAAVLTRLTRSSVVDALNDDHIRTARAKGLTEVRVIVHHALRNALLPVVTLLGIQVGYLLGGSILVETVFSWPGLGLQLYDAIGARDLPLVQGGVLLVATVFVFINLFVDVFYAVLDPRIRYAA